MIDSERNFPSGLRKQAFTLIELLVVIAVIAILSAILFPVFAQAKKSSNTTSTQSHLRQIGQGALLYMNDYDANVILASQGDNDGSRLWPVTMSPYVKSRSVFFDPTRGVPSEQNVPDGLGGTRPWFYLVSLSINNTGYTGRQPTAGNKCTGIKQGTRAFVYGRSYAAFDKPEKRIAFAPTTLGAVPVGYFFFRSDQSSWLSSANSKGKFYDLNNSVWDTRDNYVANKIPVVHADGSVGKIDRSNFVDHTQAPKLADWCAWLEKGPISTWGPFWREG